MKKAALSFILLIITCTLSVPVIYAQDIDTCVTIFAETFNGSYSGPLKNNLPSGEGTFVCKDPSEEFTLTGTWKNGVPEKSATISYANGTIATVNYANGLINGTVQELYPDNTYRTYSCSKGHPYGRITYYNSDNNLIKYDFFYQMQSVTDLISQSVTPDYNELLNTSYSMDSYCISGSVLSIYDTKKYEYILLEDNNDHLYILTYKNEDYDNFNQAIVPNLIIGDEIVAYGFFQKNAPLSSVNDLGVSSVISYPSNASTDITWYDKVKDSSLPFIRLFSAELQNTTITNTETLTYNYDNIVRNPYLYFGTDATLSGKINNIKINYDNNSLLFYLDVNSTGNLLIVQYTFSQTDVLPALNDTVSINGLYYGNRKISVETELDTDSISHTEDLTSTLAENYVIYPVIKANSVHVQ